jgi:hypothetical protein
LRGKSEATDEAISMTRLPRRLRTPRNDEVRYIGTFVDGNALKKTIRFLRKVFPYYTTSKHSKLKCQWCHLDLCPGPNPNITEYKKNIKKLILILEGKASKVLKLKFAPLKLILKPLAQAFLLSFLKVHSILLKSSVKVLSLSKIISLPSFRCCFKKVFHFLSVLKL